MLTVYEESDRRKIDIGMSELVWFVNEYGLYDLILNCIKSIAKPFKRWLTHEVLPSIRQKGGISDTATLDQLEALNTQIFAMAQKIDEIQAQKRVLEVEKQQMSDRKQHEWEIELDGKSGHPVSHERYLLDEKQAFEGAFLRLKSDIKRELAVSRTSQLKVRLVELLESHKTPKQLTGK